MKRKYLELETGITLSIKEILEIENHKDTLWEAADELCSLLANIAEAKEEEAQRLLEEAAIIKDSLKKYDLAEEMLDANAKDFIKKHYMES
jgi:hypothetical protein